MQKEANFRLIKHLAFLENELKDYCIFTSLSWEEYNKDRSKRRDVERWIENIINSSIDMAKIILNAEGHPLPDTYKGILENISIVECFDSELMERLSGWIRLRNIISHENLDIRWLSIKKFITETQPLFESFYKMVKNYLKSKQDIV
ncbi:MAG: DUF86 domain-containing protein [Nitrospirae bacterium]|nr:DUF86 domain-containing protein [Nitrospirota bacterium]